jgi:hypothetical protein
MLKPSFLEIHKNEDYKWSLIDSLTSGITNQWIEYFEMTMVYVIDEKWKLFDKEELKGKIYESDDELLDLILPSIRRVFAKVFIDPPKIFVKDPIVSEVPGYKDDGRLELFRLHFDIDEFIDYFITQLILTKECLKDFTYIDRTSETLSLIVDNYIAKLVKSVLESEDIKIDIRDLKIKRMIND